MGMYDSFQTKLKCPTCKKTALREIQTKVFENILAHYHVGDIVMGAIRGDVWLKEDWWCNECRKNKRQTTDNHIYPRFYDGLFMGFYTKEEYIEQRKKMLDTYEIMQLYHKAAELATERRFLINDIYHILTPPRSSGKQTGKDPLTSFEPKSEKELIKKVVDRIKRTGDSTLTESAPWM